MAMLKQFWEQRRDAEPALVTGRPSPAALRNPEMIDLETILTARRLVIYDTEFTSWQGSFERQWSGPGEYREIVQLGAVLLDGNLEEANNFSRLVRPKINPVLSDYFTDLTGITNDDLGRDGRTFQEVLGGFLDFCADAEFVCAFGHDDVVIRENCALLGEYDLAARIDFTNIRASLCDFAGISQGTFSAQLPGLFGLPLQSRGHEALSDARAIASVLRHLKSGGRLPGRTQLQG